MAPGLTVEVIYRDEDLVQLRVVADNGTFAGAADLYENHEVVAELTSKLAGFPNSAADRRTHELGNFNPEYGGGGVRLALSSLDHLGHCLLAVTLRADSKDGAASEATATFSIRIEPAGLDSFLASLADLGLRVGAKAHIPGDAAA